MKLKNKFKKYIHVNLQEYTKSVWGKLYKTFVEDREVGLNQWKGHFIFLEKKTQIS